jgi:hypothetical protein
VTDDTGAESVSAVGAAALVWEAIPGSASPPPTHRGGDITQPKAAVTDAESGSSGPAYLVNAGPASASDLPFDAGLGPGTGSVDTVTSAWLPDDRSGQISVVNGASVAGDLKGVAPARCSASKAVVADVGDRIRARCLCNDLLSRCNRRELWRRCQIRRESTCKGDSKMRGRISTDTLKQGGGYAIGPSR